MTTAEDKFCTCGKNFKSSLQTETSHCVPISSKYTKTIRCCCLRNKRMCTSLCRCKNRDNEYGRKPGDLEPRRKRQRHSHQISAVLFGLNLGEEINCGSRSILEFFLLEGVYEFVTSQDLQESSNSMSLIYNAIADVAGSFEEKLPIGEKSVQDMNTFLREHDHHPFCVCS